MNVTGRPAQFGRGVMIEVGSKLVEQFAQNLRQLIAEDGAAGGNTAATATDEADGGSSAGQAPAVAEPGAASTSQDGPGSTQPSPVVPPAATTPTAPPPAASADSINLVKLVGPSLLKRVVPAVVAAAGLALLGRWLFRRNAKG
jgi:hypothetical protein